MLGDRAAGAWRMRMTGDLRSLEFFTERPCVAFILEGEERFTDADGLAAKVGPQGCALLPQGLFMLSDFIADGAALDAVLFFFDADAIMAARAVAPGLRDDGRSRRLRPATIAPDPALSAFVQGLHGTYAGRNAPRPLVRLKLTELLLLLAARRGAAPVRNLLAAAREHRSPRNIVHVMRATPSARLSVADYARISGRSERGFRRAFKAAFGQPPGAWLRAKRLDDARRAVEGSDRPIAAIADEAGFASASHFIKAFRTRFGLTPGALRAAAAWPEIAIEDRTPPSQAT